MKGVLILAHGSREKSTEDTMIEIINLLKEEINECLIEFAFLQFNKKNLKTGLDQLVAQGVDEIKVIPYFLFEGIHIREDIPAEIEQYLADKKDIRITMGRPLFVDKRLAMILAERVREIL